MHQTLPIFEYPITTVFIDDDAIFLQTIKAALGNHHTRTFSNPEDFITFFTVYKKTLLKNKFLHGEKKHEDYDLLEHAPVEFDVTTIAAIHEQDSRFHEIGVIVCDYSMPTLTGLELFKQIHDAPIKKMLLTGEIQTDETVDAFNEGLINKYIPKRSPDLIMDIETSLRKLTRQYFSEQTSALLSHLEVDYPLPLSDPIFIAFFDNWCKEHHIKEFYLIDKQGSFMLIDKNNKVHYLVVHSDRSLDKFAEIYLSNPEAKALKEMVVKRKKIPFFGYAKEARHFDAKEWKKYFYSLKVLKGKEKYYWTVV